MSTRYKIYKNKAHYSNCSESWINLCAGGYFEGHIDHWRDKNNGVEIA